MWKQSLESLRDGAKEFANDFASEAREGRRALAKQARKQQQQALANPDDTSWETGGFALEVEDNSGSDDDSDSSGTSAAAGSEEVQGAFSLLQEFKAIGGGSTAGTEAPATPPPGAAEEPGSGAAAQDAAPAETAEGAEGHAEMQGRVAALAAELEGRLRWLASGKEAAEAALSRVEAAVGLITADHQEEVDRLRQRVAALETAGRVSAAAAGELLENARGRAEELQAKLSRAEARAAVARELQQRAEAGLEEARSTLAEQLRAAHAEAQRWRDAEAGLEEARSTLAEQLQAAHAEAQRAAAEATATRSRALGLESELAAAKASSRGTGGAASSSVSLPSADSFIASLGLDRKGGGRGGGAGAMDLEALRRVPLLPGGRSGAALQRRVAGQVSARTLLLVGYLAVLHVACMALASRAVHHHCEDVPVL